MINAAIIVLWCAVVLGVAAFAVYSKFFRPLREWPEATRFTVGGKAQDTREEPFYGGWWRENSGDMGLGDAVILDATLRRKIDVVSAGLTGWRYVNDPAGVDFEPVAIEQTSGDCEDHARVQALRLIEAGVPAKCMTLGFGFRLKLGWHCILILRTSEGDFFAEVGNPWFRPWDEHGFAAGNGGPVNGLMAADSDGYYRDIARA